MFFRARRSFSRGLHNYKCKRILLTNPLTIKPSGLKIVSMVSHADVIMYLVAVKSFYKKVREGEIVILDDGTLTTEDRDLLSHHLGQPTIIPISAVDTRGFPVGGTWERLLSILDFSKDGYTVQIDSDTLTRTQVQEVLDCIHENRSFTLGTRQGTERLNLMEIAERARSYRGDHMQDAAERNFARIPGAGERSYIRGSSGFAGFAKGAHSRESAAEFSGWMSEFIGDRWKEWGSEQVTSNYLVANAPGAQVLPYPRYACFNPELSYPDSSFLHFIGTYRYSGGIYSAESAAVIRNM